MIRDSIVGSSLQHHPIWDACHTILRRQDMLLIYIDVVNFGGIVRTYGEEVGDELLRVILATLRRAAYTFEEAYTQYVWDDGFVFLLPAPAADQSSEAHANTISYLMDNLERQVKQRKPAVIQDSVTFHLGKTLVKKTHGYPLPNDAHLLHTLVRTARLAKYTNGDVPSHLVAEFHDIIENRAIVPHYQPICDMSTLKPIGWEALSRGPEQSPLRTPDILFSCAAKLGELYRLEQLCRELALEQTPTCPGNDLLFLNINPQTLNDPNFVKGRTKSLAMQSGLLPQQVVFEITEHEAIHDYTTFRRTVTHYRDQGYRIAIDDTGAGYSGLRTLVELVPDYIKLDMSLIQGIHNEANKRAMVEAMVTVAQKIQAATIAEGIETEEDLQILRELGVDYGQGYLLGRPLPNSIYTLDKRQPITSA